MPLDMESNKHQFFILFSIHCCTPAVFSVFLPLFSVSGENVFLDCGINGGIWDGGMDGVGLQKRQPLPSMPWKKGPKKKS